MNNIPTLTIPVATLTPIWTGDVARTSSSIRPTSLLGSMRVWYEGIVRGMGGAACDPSRHDEQGGACIFDADAYELARSAGWRGAALLAKAGLCPACQLFGANGWQRRFRLTADGFTPHPTYFAASSDMKQAAGQWLWRIFGSTDTGGKKEGYGAVTTFAFGVRCLWADSGHFDFTTLDGDETLARLAYLVYVMSFYGAIGAKTQNGFGQFWVGSLTRELISRGRNLVRQDVAASRLTHGPANAFSLSRFFSVVYELDPDTATQYRNGLEGIGRSLRDADLYIPCAFDIRYKSVMGNIATGAGAVGLRPTLRRRWGLDAANLLLGMAGKNIPEAQRSGSRINVSHLYRIGTNKPWQLKVWGYVPPGLRDQNGVVHGVDDVALVVKDFIAGGRGMFPGSRLVVEFRPEDVL